MNQEFLIHKKLEQLALMKTVPELEKKKDKFVMLETQTFKFLAHFCSCISPGAKEIETYCLILFSFLLTKQMYKKLWISDEARYKMALFCIDLT